MPKKSKKSKAKSKGENIPPLMQGSSDPAGPPSGTPQSTFDTMVEEARSEGNALFQQKKWPEARDAYMKGAGLQTSDPNLQKAVLLNLAAANLQLDWHPTQKRWIVAIGEQERRALAPGGEASSKKWGHKNAATPFDQSIRGGKYHHLHIIPISKTDAIMSIPTTHPHELPYFDPPTQSDPLKAPLHCYIRFRYIERYASDTVSDYPTDKPILPLLNTFLPGSTNFASPSRSRKNLTFVPSGDVPNINHPTSWDPVREFLPSTLLVYAQTGRGDTILVRGEMALADVFGQVRQLSTEHSDDEDIYIELKRGMVHLFAFRSGSETERRWNDGYSKDPAELGDPIYAVSEYVDSNTDLRSRHFSYDNSEARARGTNFVTSLSWAAREGILQLLYMKD
ncbi:40S ribosomal protein [Ceratobasidium sp. 414]|nr:40S ribosomal protein [Ceratobasidium sp. 414]